MSTRLQTQVKAAPTPSFTPTRSVLLQHKCACGGAAGMSGECEECSKKKRFGLQTKLKVNEPGDVYEREADRVADQVMATPTDPVVSGAPPRIQRFSGQSDGQMDAAPASLDQALASPGRALEPALRQDMEQRFGHDLSRVRVHSGAAAAQSAQDVNAVAYTVGHDVVFGANRFAPDTHVGRRLIAHELTHVVQQSGATSATVRRQVDPKQAPAADDQPPLFTVFVADPHKRSDKRFARQQGQADAARIQESGALSMEDRQLVNAKLRFFEGDAKEAYTRQVKPTLALATRPEIELHPAYVGKLPDVEPAEQERIRRRRERTLRWFAKVKDDKLQGAYVSRLQRYLDEGMEANPDWDVEMIEQIIEERAPNARWHEAARQDFLAKREVKQRRQAREERLTTLSPYWQNQFGALAEQTQGWPEDARVYARDLLWMWNDKVAKFGNNPAAGEEMVFHYILKRYELDLRDRDRAIQEQCTKYAHREDWLMKVWGDPCKPWFENSGRRGEQELSDLHARMRLSRDEDRVPYRDIIYALQEYRKKVSALPTHLYGVHLEILQAWSMVQGGLAMAMRPMPALPTPAIGARPTTPALASRPTAPALASPPAAQLPPGAAGPKVGDIISPPAGLGLGPQRVAAVFPEGELLKPVTRMPPANRALPAPTPPAGAAIVKAPASTVPTRVTPPPTPAPGATPAPPAPTVPPPTRIPAKPPVKPARRQVYTEGELREVTGQPEVIRKRGGSSPTVEEPQTSPRATKSERAARDEQRRKEVAEAFKEAQKGIAREPGYRRDDPKWSLQTAQLEESAQFGRLNEAYLRHAMRHKLAANYDNVADQVRIRPNLDNGKPADFYFIADHLARNRQTGGNVAIDAKLSPSAPLTTNQQIGYPLLMRNGGTVESRNAPNYPYGTPLPPSPVERAQPTIDLKTTPRPEGQDVDFNFVPIE